MKKYLYTSVAFFIIILAIYSIVFSASYEQNLRIAREQSLGATVLYPGGGGTGTSTTPSFGQLLVGNSGGTYSLTATSALGITGTGGTADLATSQLGQIGDVSTSTLDNGYILTYRDSEWQSTSSIYIASNGYVGISTTIPSSVLDINGVITATGGNSTNWNSAYNNASSSLYGIFTTQASSTATYQQKLTVSATGLTLSNNTISLTGGYEIPTSASSSNWSSFYYTPSGRITAGDGIDWSTNTLNVNDVTAPMLDASDFGDFTCNGTTCSLDATYLTSTNIDTIAEINAILAGEDVASTSYYTWGDALTITGNDIDFDGGSSPGGALGGTWASPTVDSDGTWTDHNSYPTACATGVVTGIGDTLTCTATSSLAINFSNLVGTAGVTQGGTGLTSITPGGMLWASTDNTLSVLASSTNGYVLQLNSAGQPSWVSTTTLGFSGGGSASFSGTQGQIEYFSDTNTAVGTSSIFLTPSGNFGIGTTTPNYLMVIGNTTNTSFSVDSNGNSTTTGIATFGTGNNSDIAMDFNYGTTRYYTLGLDYSDSGKFKIATSSDYSTGNIFTIDINGNVGIGTSTSASRLTVGSSGAGLQISDSGVITAGTWNGDSVGVQYGGTGLTSATAGYALIGSTVSSLSATSSLFISPSGNVGVGTTSPTGKFEVSNGTHGMRVNIDESTTTLEFF